MFLKFIATYGYIQYQQNISNEDLEIVKDYLPDEELYAFLKRGKGCLWMAFCGW